MVITRTEVQEAARALGLTEWELEADQHASPARQMAEAAWDQLTQQRDRPIIAATESVAAKLERSINRSRALSREKFQIVTGGKLPRSPRRKPQWLEELRKE